MPLSPAAAPAAEPRGDSASAASLFAELPAVGAGGGAAVPAVAASSCACGVRVAGAGAGTGGGEAGVVAPAAAATEEAAEASSAVPLLSEAVAILCWWARVAWPATQPPRTTEPNGCATAFACPW